MNLYKNQISTEVLDEFLRRRKRNQNILIDLIKRLASSKSKGNSLF
jgi:hypothetical protein